MSDAAMLERFIDPDQLKKDLSIDVRNISDSMAAQTQLFVHYAQLSVRAKRQHERWKTAVEVLEAQLDSEVRRRLVEEGTKVTEAMVKAAVCTDPRWKAGNSRLIDAKEISGLCDAAERAFEHRREMLKKIAEDQAKEWQGGMRIMADGGTAQERARALISRSTPAAA